MAEQGGSELDGYLAETARYLQSWRPRGRQALFQAVVDAPFNHHFATTQLDLGITVLLLVKSEDGLIDRVALSRTPLAERAVEMSAKPFSAIRIPLHHPRNIIARAIATGRLQQTDDWSVLFTPAMTAQQARFNQFGAGIECSVVHPLKVKGGGAMIFSFFQPPANLENDLHFAFIHKYCELVGQVLTKRPNFSQRQRR